MDDRTYSLLQELANQIGTTVDFIWPILVRQAYVEALINIAFYILLIVAMFVYVKFYRSTNWAEQSEDAQAITVLGGIALVALFVIAIVSMSGTITRFINPEYHALETILQSVK